MSVPACEFACVETLLLVEVKGVIELLTMNVFSGIHKCASNPTAFLSWV